MIDQKTHTIDADGQVLGRLSTKVANLLRGKHKTGFTFHQDHGDRVIINNIDKVVLTGKKLENKRYYRHSQYPGGIKSQTAGEIKDKYPERLLINSVKNMLPDNRLRQAWMKRLVIKKD
jgi:large subunit ribosomal protein L13